MKRTSILRLVQLACGLALAGRRADAKPPVSKLRCLLACAAIVSIAVLAHAQPEEPRKYVEFKFNTNVEKALRDRLKMEKDLGPLKDLVKQFMADPSKFPITEKDLKNMKLEDEN